MASLILISPTPSSASLSNHRQQSDTHKPHSPPAGLVGPDRPRWPRGNRADSLSSFSKVATVYPIHVPALNDRRQDIPLLANHIPQTSTKSLNETLAEYENQVLHQVLVANNWNQARTARQLRIAEQTLRYKMVKLGIERPARQSNQSTKLTSFLLNDMQPDRQFIRHKIAQLRI